MSAEVSRMRGPPAAREIIRCADQQSPDLTEAPRHHGRIRKGGNAQRQIEAAADQLDRLIAQMQVDRDFRIGVEESGKRGRHVLDAERHRRLWRRSPRLRDRGAEASILETMCFERFYFSISSPPHLFHKHERVAQLELIT